MWANTRTHIRRYLHTQTHTPTITQIRRYLHTNKSLSISLYIQRIYIYIRVAAHACTMNANRHETAPGLIFHTLVYFPIFVFTAAEGSVRHNNSQQPRAKAGLTPVQQSTSPPVHQFTSPPIHQSTSTPGHHDVLCSGSQVELGDRASRARLENRFRVKHRTHTKSIRSNRTERR